MRLVEISSYFILCRIVLETPKRDHKEHSLVMETSVQRNRVSWQQKPHIFKVQEFFSFSLSQQRNDISLYLVSREFFQEILMDHNNKSLSSAVKPWTRFLRKRKNWIVRCKGLLNIMRFTKAGYSCSFPAMTRLQGNRKCHLLKQKFYMRIFSFEVPRIHSWLPGDLAETTTHLQWK